MTLILATSISDITSQYVCITHLHGNLDNANVKLRSFLPHDLDMFLLAKQVKFKVTDSDSVSVYKCRLITTQTTQFSNRYFVLYFAGLWSQDDGYNLKDDRH